MKMNLSLRQWEETALRYHSDTDDTLTCIYYVFSYLTCWRDKADDV